jgi:hypothetical protein
MNKLRSKLGIWLMKRAYDIMPEDDKQTFDNISFFGYQVLVQMRRHQALAALHQQNRAAEPDLNSMLDSDKTPEEILSSTQKPRLH